MYVVAEAVTWRKERAGGQRFNHMAALVSNYKDFVDKGGSQTLGWLKGNLNLSLSISSLSPQF